jgi:hypothetical protein
VEYRLQAVTGSNLQELGVCREEKYQVPELLKAELQPDNPQLPPGLVLQATKMRGEQQQVDKCSGLIHIREKE